MMDKYPFMDANDGGEFYDYLVSKQVCDAAIHAAYQRTYREFWPTMCVGWRLCLMNLLDGRPLLDQGYKAEAEKAIGWLLSWAPGIRTMDRAANQWLDENYPREKFDDAARKLGLL